MINDIQQKRRAKFLDGHEVEVNFSMLYWEDAKHIKQPQVSFEIFRSCDLLLITKECFGRMSNVLRECHQAVKDAYKLLHFGTLTKVFGAKSLDVGSLGCSWKRWVQAMPCDDGMDRMDGKLPKGLCHSEADHKVERQEIRFKHFFRVATSSSEVKACAFKFAPGLFCASTIFNRIHHLSSVSVKA